MAQVKRPVTKRYWPGKAPEFAQEDREEKSEKVVERVKPIEKFDRRLARTAHVEREDRRHRVDTEVAEVVEVVETTEETKEKVFISLESRKSMGSTCSIHHSVSSFIFPLKIPPPLFLL
jgi:polyphosphate kinase 2 (PPK2 family)